MELTERGKKSTLSLRVRNVLEATSPIIYSFLLQEQEQVVQRVGGKLRISTSSYFWIASARIRNKDFLIEIVNVL